MAFRRSRSYIGAGLSYVQKLDMRLNEEHPPLAKLLSGLALAIGGASADYSSISWTISRDFFPSFLGEWVFGDRVVNHWNNPTRALALARLPMLALTLALGWLLFVLGLMASGRHTRRVALPLTAFVTSPVFLAFGPLVLTDVAITLFSLWTLWSFADLWQDPRQDPSRRRVFLFALSLAAALLSQVFWPKHSRDRADCVRARHPLVLPSHRSPLTRWPPVPGERRVGAQREKACSSR